MNDFILHTAVTICPHCGHTLNTVQETANPITRPPRPGDVCLCLQCAGISVYSDELGNVRRAGPAEIDALMQNSEVWDEINQARRRILEVSRG